MLIEAPTAIAAATRHPKIPHDKDPDHTKGKKVFEITGPKAKDFDFVEVPHKTRDDVFAKVRLGIFKVKMKAGGPDPGTAEEKYVKKPGHFAVGQEITAPFDPDNVDRSQVEYHDANRVSVTIGTVKYEVTTETDLV